VQRQVAVETARCAAEARKERAKAAGLARDVAKRGGEGLMEAGHAAKKVKAESETTDAAQAKSQKEDLCEQVAALTAAKEGLIKQLMAAPPSQPDNGKRPTANKPPVPPKHPPSDLPLGPVNPTPRPVAMEVEPHRAAPNGTSTGPS